MNNVHRVADNQLMLLKNGAAYFPQLCADIDAAQHSIYLETYIFFADETGRMVADALRRAAARGVVGARAAGWLRLGGIAAALAGRVARGEGPGAMVPPRDLAVHVAPQPDAAPAPFAPQAGGGGWRGGFCRRHQYHQRCFQP